MSQKAPLSAVCPQLLYISKCLVTGVCDAECHACGCSNVVIKNP